MKEIENLRLVFELVGFLAEKGDITRHIRYDEFMAMSTNIGSLAQELQIAEMIRLQYERARRDVLDRVDRLKELAVVGA